VIETVRALRPRETVKRRSGRPSHGPPGPRRGTASPPPTGSGDHGGSLGGGERQEYKHSRTMGQGLFSSSVFMPQSNRLSMSRPGSPKRKPGRARRAPAVAEVTPRPTASDAQQGTRRRCCRPLSDTAS